MDVVKRIEIIAIEHEMPRILKALDQVGVPGYTVIRNVTGKTPGSTIDNDLTFVGLGNVYVICFCQEDLLPKVATAITPLLNKFGGVCYVSEAIALGITHSWSAEDSAS
jgi:nitrogen regulatory protein PII